MKYWQVSIAVVALGILAIGTSTSFAASDPIYMNFPGISGSTIEKGFENQIQLNSFQWGVGRAISSSTSGTKETSTPSVSEIVITKMMDKASPDLLKNSLVGAPTTTPVTIQFTKQTSLGLQRYAEYQLSNVLISGYSISSGGDTPTESLSLSFSKVIFTFWPTNPDGSLGLPITTSYDLVSGQAT